MKELDFDELDRAVNSLVGQVDDKAGTAKINKPALAADDRQTGSSQSTAQRVAVSTPTPPTPQKKPVAPVNPGHRSGRLDIKRPTKAAGKGFIDIVAPKPSTTPRVSRTSGTIQPVSKEPVVREPAEPTTPVAPADKAVEVPKAPVEATPSPVPKPIPKAAEEKWPDPLDFHPENTPTIAKEPQKRAEPEGTPDSPFIPGAKVEKRPLGAFTPAVSGEEKAAAPEEVELTEASVKTEVPEIPPAQQAEALSETTATEQKTDVDVEEPEPSATAEEPPAKQMHESAMMSIPQQYATANKTVDESPRPVFDTKEYHPPLLESTAHAAHHSNPWSKLLVALLIITVLAVGGYFAFMYFVQNF